MMKSGSSRATPCFWLLTALTACFCIFILHLPLFPSEDGPIHLYFISVLASLLGHQPSIYRDSYFVHHLLPPYSLHYYLILCLMRIVPAVSADKIFVCLILINFAFGFRYLVTAIGPAGNVLSLLVTALLFNWPLGMGFENFSFSVGLACWAIGVWIRLEKLNSYKLRISFILLLMVMMLTHPVPLIMSLAFIGLDLLLRFLAAVSWSRRPPRLADTLTVVVGGSTLGYIYLFTEKHASLQTARTHVSFTGRIIHLTQLSGLAFFGGISTLSVLYRLTLYLIFLIAIVMGVSAAMKQLQRRQWNAQLTSMTATLLFICAQPFLPADLNGSHWLAERLLIFVWIAVVAAASGAVVPGRFSQASIMIFAIFITVDVLILGHAYLEPAAQHIAEITRPPNQAPGRIGLLLPASDEKYTFNENLRFYPFLWAGTHYFRQNRAVLLNTPWMDLPILPLGARPLLMTNHFSSEELEDARFLRNHLINSPETRSALLARVDIILFQDPEHNPDQSGIDLILTTDPAIRWSCTRSDWYVLCNKSE